MMNGNDDKLVESAHNTLVSLMHKHAEKFQKKHGNFMRLHLDDDNYLIMDSWNKSIKCVQGICDYDNQFTGFTNYKLKEYLGGNFGGFMKGAEYETLNRYIDFITKKI